MSDFDLIEDDFIQVEDEYEDVAEEGDEEEEVAEADNEENEFVDRQLTVLTEEKADGFDEEELMNDELRDDDISQYGEMVEEVTEFSTGKNPYKTGKFLTKYEYPRIVSTRATQIQHGAEPKVPVRDPETGRKLSPLEIAEEELRQDKLPLVIQRILPTKVPHKYTYEVRPLNTLLKG